MAQSRRRRGRDRDIIYQPTAVRARAGQRKIHETIRVDNSEKPPGIHRRPQRSQNG